MNLKKFHIIIIGAGASGATAAWNLSKNKIVIDGVFIDADPKTGLEFHGHKFGSDAVLYAV